MMLKMTIIIFMVINGIKFKTAKLIWLKVRNELASQYLEGQLTALPHWKLLNRYFDSETPDEIAAFHQGQHSFVA